MITLELCHVGTQGAMVAFRYWTRQRELATPYIVTYYDPVETLLVM